MRLGEPPEAGIFGLNGSFWPQRVSLMVSECPALPGPSSGLEVVKVTEMGISWLQFVLT